MVLRNRKGTGFCEPLYSYSQMLVSIFGDGQFVRKEAQHAARELLCISQFMLIWDINWAYLKNK